MELWRIQQFQKVDNINFQDDVESQTIDILFWVALALRDFLLFGSFLFYESNSFFKHRIIVVLINELENNFGGVLMNNN